MGPVFLLPICPKAAASLLGTASLGVATRKKGRGALFLSAFRLKTTGMASILVAVEGCELYLLSKSEPTLVSNLRSDALFLCDLEKAKKNNRVSVNLPVSKINYFEKYTVYLFPN